MARRLLIVDVKQGRNLVACESKGTSNPYGTIVLKDIAGRPIKKEEAEIPAKNKTLSPEWSNRITLGEIYLFI
jgi:accessory colonization factor AcfC